MSEVKNYEEKFQRFSNIVSTKTMEGYIVIDRNDRALIAVLEKPAGKVNHVLHLIMTLFTCSIWLVVWLILIFVNRGGQRLRVSIDEAGNVLEERIKS